MHFFVRMSKKFLFLCFFLLSLAHLHAIGPLSGYAGVYVQLSPSEDVGYIPNAYAQAFLSSQISLGRAFAIRSSFNVDVTSDGTEMSESSFALESLAFDFKINHGYSYSNISLYMKDEDSFGSSLFLQRHFGIEDITSPILVNKSGSHGQGMFTYDNPGFFGGGLSYLFRSSTNWILGGYLNAALVDEKLDGGLDLRFSIYWDNLIIDTSLGAKVSVDLFENVGVETAAVRAGFMALFGDRSATNVLLQMGLADFKVYSQRDDEPALDPSRFFFVFEPRMHFEAPQAEFPFDVNWTLYWMPPGMQDKFLYIDNPLGTSAGFMFNSLTKNNLEVNVFITVSTSSLTLEDLDYALTTVMKVRLFNGIFHMAARLQLNYLDIPHLGYEFNLGYRMSL